MERIKLSVANLSDEEVLKEFLKRFECDGAVLIYMESKTEFGFGRWRNSDGRKWVKNLFKSIKKDSTINVLSERVENYVA